MKTKLLFAAGMFTLLWGVAHLFPTAGVVDDFGDISHDNRLIILMEWMVEGLALIFLGTLTIVVTITDATSRLAKNVYILIIAMLFSLTILSLFTGFQVDFLPFKLCPVIFSVSAILIILGMQLKPRNSQ
jgi:hypothetical protein